MNFNGRAVVFQNQVDDFWGQTTQDSGSIRPDHRESPVQFLLAGYFDYFAYRVAEESLIEPVGPRLRHNREGRMRLKAARKHRHSLRPDEVLIPELLKRGVINRF